MKNHLSSLLLIFASISSTFVATASPVRATAKALPTPTASKSTPLPTADTLEIRTLQQIVDQTRVTADIPSFNRLLAPWVFAEYRALDHARKIDIPSLQSQYSKIWKLADENLRRYGSTEMQRRADSIAERHRYLDKLWGTDTELGNELREERELAHIIADSIKSQEFSILADPTPKWMLSAFEAWNLQEDIMYSMMVADPSLIKYAYWQLPVPPTLKEDDHSFGGFLQRQNIGGIDVEAARIKQYDIEKIHWLHVINNALQFSQAFVSPNWYQGGNNYLSTLFNFMWDVQLNPVWHPDLLVQSTVSYKLGFNSTQDDPKHKYSISQDIFQYNGKIGYKARKNWYYSLTAQFKTQLLNNYAKNTDRLIASFLTPGDLNVGAGMTFSKQNKKKTWQFNMSLAPLSYNLKTAINPDITHTQWGIEADKKTVSAFGSNADITLNWKIFPNTSYMTRLFLFTDYKYGYGNWEHTVNFQFNKFFSTQLYVNMRYDSSADDTKAPDWKKFMLKEILSVGLSYTFSTK